MSPSAAGRWLVCTPSARLEERFPDKAGDFAQEGSLAHEFGEAILKGSDESHLSKLRTEKFYSEEMEEYARGYAELYKRSSSWQKGQLPTPYCA